MMMMWTFLIIIIIIHVDIIIHVTGNKDHVCARDCSGQDVDGRVCYYHFKLEWFHTLGRACFDCPFNITDCSRPECISADGARRAIVTVNRMLPGPIIEVCEGDTVIVDVHNDLGAESTSFHWHGLHQRGSPHMDGVPMVTQCPILPHTTFRYQFQAQDPGTHFWHSHSALQRADGAYGPLIVRQRKDPHEHLYDHDLNEHVILIADWFDVVGVEKMTAHFYDGGDNKPASLLINGKGRSAPVERDGQSVFTPIAEFQVHKDNRYRFRLISNGVLNCPVVFSIDQHNLTVIATDGTPVKPYVTDSVVIYAGERFDFVLSTEASVDRYWMRFQGLMDCDERFTAVKQVALLVYSGVENVSTVYPSFDYSSMRRNGTQLNPLNSATNGSLVSLVEMESIVDENFLKEDVDHQFYLGFDFSLLDSDLYHPSDLYPIRGFDHHHRIYVPQVNNRTLVFPSSPLLTQHDDVSSDLFCSATKPLTDCDRHLCRCLHTLDIPLGSVIELVLVDTGFHYDANHPIHIHGHAFHVVAMEKIDNQVTMQQVKDMDKSGKIRRKLDKPVRKDTITIPDGGFTIVRFRANNPGYWLLHCHIAFHMEMGMAVILKVGEHDQFPPSPLGFPTCGNWVTQPTLTTSSNGVPSTVTYSLLCLSLVLIISL